MCVCVAVCFVCGLSYKAVSYEVANTLLNLGVLQVCVAV